MRQRIREIAKIVYRSVIIIIIITNQKLNMQWVVHKLSFMVSSKNIWLGLYKRWFRGSSLGVWYSRAMISY